MTEPPAPSPSPDHAPSLRITASDDDRRAIDALLARAAAERVPQRLWDRDDTLWGPAGQAEVADRLAWLDAPAATRELASELDALTGAITAEGYTDVLLVGMGGSSLAPAVIGSLDPRAPRRLRMLDSTDPDAIASVDAATDPDRTLVLVSTKSGGTIETISLFRHFWSRRPDGAGFVAVTDPGSGLEQLAEQHGFRAIFRADPEIGGRYSALSPFGIVPAALVGLDYGGLLDGGQAGLDAARADLPDNAAVRLGVAIAALTAAGRDKLVVRVQDPLLGHFSLWLEQLVAESTGKHGVGVLPVIDDPGAEIAVRDLTGPDRQLLVVRGSEDDPSLDAEIASAVEAGVPVLELMLDHDPERESSLAQLGWAFATTEVAVAVAGWGLAINPFDQPDVQAAKDATQAVLAELAAGGTLSPSADATADAIAEFAAGLGAPGYLALLAYVPPSPTGAAAIERLRAALVGRTDAAVTAGFGPRYLHSTGQLHKGGPPGGRFLILEHEPRATRAIPGGSDSHPPQPHPTDSFAALIRAQAEGDEHTLAAHDRAVLRLNLGTDWLERLDAIVSDLEGRSL
jgi:glucose-6-phosphate isomerase